MLTEADAIRKLRISSRAELDLRDILSEREKRIHSLKQQKNMPEFETLPNSPLMTLRIRIAQHEAEIAALQRELAHERAMVKPASKHVEVNEESEGERVLQERIHEMETSEAELRHELKRAQKTIDALRHLVTQIAVAKGVSVSKFLDDSITNDKLHNATASSSSHDDGDSNSVSSFSSTIIEMSKQMTEKDHVIQQLKQQIAVLNATPTRQPSSTASNSDKQATQNAEVSTHARTIDV